VPTAVSVGSIGPTDEVSWFSNVAPFLTLFAPGENITSALQGGGFTAADGTSAATPHVAGAWAVLKQAAPSATVDEILEALTSTGLPVTEPFSGVTKPRIRVFEALATLSPIPLLGAITPSRGGQGETLDVTIGGAKFQAGATVSFGPDVTVTAVDVVSDREIVATLTIPLTATVGLRTVTVTNPDATSVSRAGAFTVTLPPPHVSLVWNGKVRDRVGPTEGQGAPDGQLDGTLTATVTNGARTVTQLAMVATGGGTGDWDTIPDNSLWILGAALTQTSPLLNAANGAVSFAVADGGSFSVFGTDWFEGKFVPGTTLTLTVSFSDGTVAAAGVTIPVVPTVTAVSPSGGEQETTVPVAVTGTKFQTGATLSVGPGVTVTNVAVPSQTQLTATLQIAVDAPVGARDVVVTNPGGASATLVGGFGVTAPGVPPPPPPPPPGITLVWNGKAQDRVGPTEGQGAPDGYPDGTLTATVTGGARTVTRVVLVATGGGVGQWDTIPSNSQWVLGVAATQTAALFNAGNGSVSFAVADGGSFSVFGTDWYDSKFVAGTTLTLTVTFSDDTVAGASRTLP
jgi:hypothetical protein